MPFARGFAVQRTADARIAPNCRKFNVSPQMKRASSVLGDSSPRGRKRAGLDLGGWIWVFSGAILMLSGHGQSGAELMVYTKLLLKKLALTFGALCVCALAARAGNGNFVSRSASVGGPVSSPITYSYFNPGFGFSPFLNFNYSSAPRPFMPKYWWTGSYSIADPRQDGYNPQGGYRWEDVTTLVLGTYPTRAEVTLDGSPIGSSDGLGPIQLPFGEHTLRVESPGYEPSETVLKVQARSVQRLQVNLKPAGSSTTVH